MEQELKPMTQEVIETACNYRAKVAGLTLTTLDVKTHLRYLGYDASQYEVSVGMKRWAHETVGVNSYFTYAYDAPVEEVEEVEYDVEVGCNCDFGCEECDPRVEGGMTPLWDVLASVETEVETGPCGDCEVCTEFPQD